MPSLYRSILIQRLNFTLTPANFAAAAQAPSSRAFLNAILKVSAECHNTGEEGECEGERGAEITNHGRARVRVRSPIDGPVCVQQLEDGLAVHFGRDVDTGHVQQRRRQVDVEHDVRVPAGERGRRKMSAESGTSSECRRCTASLTRRPAPRWGLARRTERGCRTRRAWTCP